MASVKQIELSCVCNYCFYSCEAVFVSLVHYVLIPEWFSLIILMTLIVMQITRHAFCCMVPLAYQVAAIVLRYTLEERDHHKFNTKTKKTKLIKAMRHSHKSD